jgi:hypothetical protein
MSADTIRKRLEAIDALDGRAKFNSNPWAFASVPPQRYDHRGVKACTVCGAPCEGPRCNTHGGNRRAMTTTQRGYGWQHQQRRVALMTAAIGHPCPLCGRTMMPGQTLDLDHSTRLVDNPNSVGDRIMHSACNRGGGFRS